MYFPPHYPLRCTRENERYTEYVYSLNNTVRAILSVVICWFPETWAELEIVSSLRISTAKPELKSTIWLLYQWTQCSCFSEHATACFIKQCTINWREKVKHDATQYPSGGGRESDIFLRRRWGKIWQDEDPSIFFSKVPGGTSDLFLLPILRSYTFDRVFLESGWPAVHVTLRSQPALQSGSWLRVASIIL